MDLTRFDSGALSLLGPQVAQETKREKTWVSMGQVPLAEALEAWLYNLAPLTAKSYRAGFKALEQRGIVSFDENLQRFSLLNHELKVDQIKAEPGWSEATRQARAAAYISFTGFLQRRTAGLITKAQSNREGANKTFFKIREKVKTPALDPEQTKAFFSALDQLNPRDGLIGKLILQGGKRKGEVLGVLIEQIDYKNNRISFVQSKTKGMIKETIITYPAFLMAELQTYIAGRKQGLCFISQNGRRLAPNQIDRNFKKAGALAGIPFVVSPHVLRVTLVTRLKEYKVQDSDIIKITGHASPVQLLAYDKTNPADNASARFNLV
ncbi:MAG: hypothetical protein A2527_13605 [Candidatus Lambdaproteobacteria bacterium RIFOXYD2_FULL_50_16]|uniref:Tyr recombinase domain-containing protein n=1 Tax=Candidatus Lambdaproteobacteria bacterium RIFOXYD2_FULL_50_16 TaxID=1817772 RepID=A0A1F6G585_9PROT|nr:MAG: hypothetical protein A2527_13605 [Candidatus Lambdaproteobacteria bacterium RIFOXYD2_FULL_50_16]